MSTLISGHVVDQNRRPVANARVSINGQLLAETNRDGSFSANVAAPDPRLAVTVSARGFVTNTRVLDGKIAGRGNTVVLWPIAATLTFDPMMTLDVSFGKARIQIPAGALVDENEQTMRERVELRWTLFDVANATQRSAASGDFSGKLLDGRICRLNSFGIFDFDLRRLDGKRPKLRRDVGIQLAVPIPPKLTKKAPKNIGFYNFDRPTGRWIQIGQFELSPSTLTYNGTVHSYGGVHNLDDPQDTVCITVRAVNVWDSSPLTNATLVAHGDQYDSSGTTDSDGLVCLLVQRNAQFNVTGSAIYGSSHWYTTAPVTFTSPDFSSGAGDCGNSDSCPFLGDVPLDLIVGFP